jgi:DNA-binding SARP family transcriptional activator/tetratricopeptide (TPR) repeat protein
MDDALIGVLGRLVISLDGRSVEISAAKQRAVFGILVLQANRFVTTDRLVYELWGDTPPPSGAGTLQSIISRLRRPIRTSVETLQLESSSGGYRLHVADSLIDAHRFEELAKQGTEHAANGRLQRSADVLATALGLWRGPMLADVPQTSMISAEAARLDELRINLTEGRIHADLQLGRCADLIAELRGLVAEHPFRERLWELLMLALHRCGRRSEALEVYRSAYKMFTTEFGIEPGRPLRDLHDEFLGDSVTPAGTAEINTLPRQLPAAVSNFVGREHQVSAIGDFLTEARKRSVPIAVVSGMPGVGKTTLAMHAAHEIRGHFPDGQLYADLGGTTRMTPSHVLAQFLRALGIPGRDIPQDPAERAGFFRSRVAGRRMLIVLDNAADESQVEPMLPGDPECAVIVTSRRRLPGLGGAYQLELGGLTRAQSIDLLAGGLGDVRMVTEPVAIGELADLCGGLPLALRISAARLAANPHWTASSMVKRLRVRHQRLSELQYGRLHVKASFTFSYESLTAVAQRLFRRLGLLESRDFPGWVAGAVLDVGHTAGQEALDQLVDANMLEVTGRDGGVRYRFHDLIHDYSRLEGHREEEETTRRAAVGRALGGWLHLAEQACHVAFGSAYMLSHGDAPRWRPDAGHLLDDPWEWLEAERSCLITGVAQAARTEMHELCWDLAGTSTALFGTGGYFDDWQETHDVALAATRKAGNLRGEAVIMRHLGGLRLFQGRFEEARGWLELAQPIFREIADLQGEAFTVIGLGIAERRSGQYDPALRHFDTAVEMLTTLDDQLGVAHASRHIGQIYQALGHLDAAKRYLLTALETARAVGCLPVEGHVRYCLGELQLNGGRHDAAIAAFTRAAEIAERVRDRRNHARALFGAARVHLALADHPRAVGRLCQALELAREAGDEKMAAKIVDIRKLVG